jgi:anti-sigma regulatory factor (Ser/Thr protein kinase)
MPDVPDADPGRRPDGGSLFVLLIERTEQGLAGIGLWVDEIARTLSLTGVEEYALRLCVEEAVANLVMHGVAIPGIDASCVSLEVERAAVGLRLCVSDRCLPFDPHAMPAQGALDDDPDRRIGGYGMMLMRQHARDIRYRREGDTNHLTLLLPRLD